MDERIYSKNIVEFVTVGVEFCAFVERAQEMNKKDFTDKITKILPLLYLKASLLSPTEPDEENMPEHFVTEEVYEYVRMNIETVLGESDSYLEVFHNDMQYSETPLAASIAEGIADVYQDIKDFISVYRLGNEPLMLEAIYQCHENFVSYWGLQLLNVLRALHVVLYSENENDEFENDTPRQDDTTAAGKSNPFAQRQEDWSEDIDLKAWDKWNE